MTLPTAATLYRVIDATWPAARMIHLDPWIVRAGNGGGNRVSAATVQGGFDDACIARAEAAMHSLHQPALFMIRDIDSALDQRLAQLGYQIKDPVTLYAAPTAAIAIKRPPPVTSFEVWPPLQAQIEIWEEGGIGPGRIAVMDRAAVPKTTILGRLNEAPAGTLYAGIAHDCAMIHALEVAPAHRRQGHARDLTIAAAFWAKAQGAAFVTLVTTQANVAANTLYTSLGMQPVGQYHYRIKVDPDP